jgi:hypothetical protein
MSRCSSAIHSPGRTPVAAANSTSGPWLGPIWSASCLMSAHESNGRCSMRDRCGFSTPSLAALVLSKPQLTALARIWRSAWVASKRCPRGIVIRHAAISAGRSSLIGRSSKNRVDLVDSHLRFSIVSGSASCWARYASTSSLSVGPSAKPCSCRSRSSARSSASAAACSDGKPPRWTALTRVRRRDTGRPSTSRPRCSI